ncbi:hypothetical protein [Arachnia propionica]|uniref:Uncharacterized protein n=1 Tax=Arachnia propionica TaxID=1750 RepID=A0A3P1WNZ4_9ACTN|nr:hypothetical protein [Arachnia propionica]RRD47070.1 hypothetical protein EII35_15250 [Arachnia propionica]
MPTEYADHYDLVVPEGWEVARWDQYEKAFFFGRRVEDVDPPAAVSIENWGGEWADEFTDRPLRVNALSWEEVFETQRREFSSSEFFGFEVLPERTIGGERAVGMTVHQVGEKSGKESVWEQWHVLRHDGVWLFDLFSGGGRDRVGDDAYGILDSFRWTGPAPSPLPEPLPVPTPRQR